MNERSQMTMYVILGIVILIVIGIIFFLKTNIINSLSNQEQQKIKEVPPQVQVINDFVQDCLESTSRDALYIIGQQGGYFVIPNLSTSNGISYYFYNNKPYIPSREVIENEISKYIDWGSTSCTNNFVNFLEFKINQGNVKAKTSISDNKTLIEVEYLLIINKGQVNYQLKNFNIELPIRLGIIYDVSKTIIDKQVENPSSICLSCILELEYKNDLAVGMTNYGNSTMIYMLADTKSLLNREPYNFIFAVGLENE